MFASLGQTLLYLAILLSWILFIFTTMKTKLTRKDTKIIFIMVLLIPIFLWITFGMLIYLFIQKQYNFIVVYSFSDNSMDLSERIMAVWASRQGVMILWAALTATIALSFTIVFRKDGNDPIIKKSLNILYFFSALITTFTMSSRPAAFATGPNVNDGVGLNPSLLSPWQEMHPPLAFLAYSVFIVPYATGIALLKRTSDNTHIKQKIYWINDLFIILGWGLTGIFMVAGSIWGYEENWAGFWAWDPVEIATLILWIAATLHFHVKTQVANNHPLQSATASLGWVTVTFSAFVVRGGILSGLHSYAGLAKAIVFFLLFIGSFTYWFIAIIKHQANIIPEKLYSLRESNRKSVLLGLWLLTAAFIVNSFGLILQMVFKLTLNQSETPYEYYIYLNMIIFLGFLGLIFTYHLNESKLARQKQIFLANFSVIISGFLISNLIDIGLMGFLVVTFTGGIVVGLFALTIYELIVRKSKLRKLNIVFVHFAISLLIFSYVTVDYNTTGVTETLLPGQSLHVEEFDITVIGYRVSGNEFPRILLDVFDHENTNTQLELKQGIYQGNYWTRGAWITLKNYDLYFIMINSGDMVFQYNAPIILEIQLKPLPNTFRISFFLLIFVTLTGFVKYLRNIPKNGGYQIEE